MTKSLYSNLWLQMTASMFLLLLSACGGSGGGDDPAPPPATNGSFDIAGTITPTSGSRIDSDVNDPDYDYVTNDSINNAQPLPNPVILGGFVSVSGSGASRSRFLNIGDTRDFYSVQLLAGQVIRLSLADPMSNIDLVLLDNTGTELLRPALGLGMDENITIPGTFTGARDFFIEVRAMAGNSNYVLSVGLAVSPVSAKDLMQDFVEGEVVVKFKDTVLPQGVTVDTMSMRADTVGLQAVAGAPGRSMLMRMGNAGQFALARKKLKMIEGSEAISGSLQGKLDTIRVMQALARRADVESARLNYIYKAMAIPDDPNYPIQWHYPLINLPQAWDVTQGSADVTVAVIDTGVLLNHPDLQNKLVPGYDFIRDASVAADGESDGIIGDIDSNPDDPGDGGPGLRSSFHGTHVAGTIAAKTNNAIGVAGVGWNVKVMPLRALGVGVGTSYDIEQAVRFAAGLANDSNTLPAKRADIINLSLGGPGGAGTTPEAYRLAREAGVIIVAAAGNEGTDIPIYPASYDDAVISVSAIDLNKERAFYSSFGTHIDVAAPGGDSSRNLNGDTFPDGVMSTGGSDASLPITYTYGLKQGTSMATPHIAGVAALMKSVHPGLSVDDFVNALNTGSITEDLGDTGRDDQFGHGLIDALKAVLTAQQLAAGGVVPDNPFMAVSPGSVNFGSSGVTAALNVRNAGTGTTPLTITSVTNDSGGWLTHTPPTGGGDLGDYVFTADRSGLADNNIYSATITIVSSVNTATIPVIMQKTSIQTFDDAGVLYVFLLDSAGQQAIDPVTALPIDPVAVRPINGQYQYRFDNIAVGEYQILAGTDMDNDLKVCDAGEACGNYYDSTAERSIFTLDQDLLDADFIVDFTDSTSTLDISVFGNIQQDANAKQLSR